MPTKSNLPMNPLIQRLLRAEAIVKEVKALRLSQKEYFTYKEASMLRRCKLQEVKIDEMIRDYEQGTTQSLLGE